MSPQVIHRFAVWGATAGKQRNYLQMGFYVLMCSFRIHDCEVTFTLKCRSLVNMKNIKEWQRPICHNRFYLSIIFMLTFIYFSMSYFVCICV